MDEKAVAVLDKYMAWGPFLKKTQSAAQKTAEADNRAQLFAGCEGCSSGGGGGGSCSSGGDGNGCTGCSGCGQGGGS